MGWGGWGATTVQGDYARGMGMFAAGAGVFNEATARANAINAETAMHWNEYWYQSQRATNRRYFARMAARRENGIANRAAMFERLRDNPTRADIHRGDALNVIFDELCNPKIYLNGLSGSGAAFPGETVRDIPFQYAPQGVTATVRSILTKDLAPDVLRKPPFADDFAKLKEIGTKLTQQNAEEDAQIDPKTIDEAVAVIHTMQAKVRETLPQGTRDRTASDLFLRASLGFLKMLRTPAINVLLADVDKQPSTTVGHLLGFMKAFNLRFGAARDARQRMAYDRLFPILVRLRDEAYPTQKLSMGEDTDVEPGVPTDFFETMDEKAFENNPIPTSAPAAASTPAAPGPK